MNEKFELTKFSAGDTKEHEGITYKAVRQERYAKSGTPRAGRNVQGVRVPQERRTLQKP